MLLQPSVNPLLFKVASEGRRPWYKTLDDEREFTKRYYRALLIEEDVEDKLDSRAELLFSELWCNGDRVLFPETILFKQRQIMLQGIGMLALLASILRISIRPFLSGVTR